MINCKKEWFAGINDADINIERRLCPDMDKIAKLKPEFWQLKGKYDDEKRTSFAVIVEVCKHREDCKPEKEIMGFLEGTYLSEYQLQKKAVLVKDDTTGYVVQSENVLLQQIQVFYDRYTDNNNYVEYDKVTTKDSRVNFLSSGETFDAFKVERGHTWLGRPLKRQRKLTEDNGKTFFMSNQSHTIFGAYYFYSSNMWESTREARNWFHVLSDAGGLYSIIIAIFQMLADEVNDKKWISKQIRNFFLQVQMTVSGPSFSKVKLKASEMMKRDRTAKVMSEYFAKGETKLQRNLDIFRVIQSIQKVQACVTILIDKLPDKEDILERINKLHVMTKTIWLDSQETEKKGLEREMEDFLDTYHYFDSLNSECDSQEEKDDEMMRTLGRDNAP